MEYYRINHQIEKSDLNQFQYPNRKIGVIVHIVDESGRILLQQRGKNLVMKTVCMKMLVVN